MKIEKVTIEGTQNFELNCGGEGDETDYNCTSLSNITILWKQPKGMFACSDVISLTVLDFTHNTTPTSYSRMYVT